LSQRSYQPPAEAQRAYALGVNALYSMTYETARKALEQSVAIDPSFALAHASLARAYDELDYTDRAKDAMLRAVAAAQESRLSPADDRKLRALQFMVSRDYERAAPIVKELEADARIADRPAAALESGWLAQQMENTDAAAAAYQRALTLDPSYAAAKLRLGFLFGRQGGKDEQALAAFGEAEGLYRTAGNIEGVTQTLLERANLLDRRNREKEAMPMIEDALTMARAVGNRYQEVRLRFIQATAVRDLGDTARAAMLVREAIDAALAENMDNLAANGQIDLGNLHLRAKQLELAEPVFRRALDIARRAKVARIAARAQASLGALLEQLHRPAEATPLMEAALLFYREAGYRRESVQAATVLGGLHRLAGESDKAIQVLTDALPLAVQLEDQRVEAQIHERLADSLSDRGSWSAAIDEYERASQLYGSTVSGQTARENAARLRAQIGTNVNR
jgi:tetratricopeptide (TPR) repeat protein